MYEGIRRIGELSKDGVFIFDFKVEKFTYLNDAFAVIFDTSISQLMANPSVLLPFIRSEDNFYLRRRYVELLKSHTIINTEFRVHLHRTPLKHLCCDAYLLTDTLLAGFVKDVTKEREHEDYIMNYGAKKDTLLDMVTHNLSGPLHLSKNILGWMQQTYKDSLPGEISSQLLLIQNNTQECLDIVNDFLKEEHLESERIFVRKTRFDLLERLMATLDKMVATNKNKKFRVITDLQNLNICTDSVKFFQAIHNLISNSIKFTPENGEIDLLVEEKETTFIIRVRDNGIGIPPDMHDRLFIRNSAVGRDGLNREKSTGLGLHIVKTLVTLMDGKIWFESEESKGTTFSIELPKE